MASGSHQGEPWSSSLSPTVTLVRNGPVNTACRTLIEESSGCEDDQAALQGAENRSCLAQVMRSGTVGLASCGAEPGADAGTDGAVPLDDELVDVIVLHVDDGLAVLHLDAQVVVVGLYLLYVVGLYGEGVAPVPDDEARPFVSRLVYDLLDQLPFHQSASCL